MEITKLFKACVRAVKAKRKDISSDLILPKSKIKKTKTEKSFNTRATEVVTAYLFIFIVYLMKTLRASTHLH